MILTIQHLSVGDRLNPILRDINLQLDAGELLAITGMNGAGKSTLLKAISGDQTFQSGEILLNGRSRRQWPLRNLARFISVLPQRHQANFNFSAEELVLLGRYPHDTGALKDREIAASALKFCDAFHLRNKAYNQMSGGEQQRIQLARVLCQIWQRRKNQGRILLLDEPTTGLDLAHQQEFFYRLRKFAESGVGVVFVAHDLNLASQFADRIAILHKGRMVANNYPNKVLTPNNLLKFFKLKAEVSEHPIHSVPLVIPI